MTSYHRGVIVRNSTVFTSREQRERVNFGMVHVWCWCGLFVGVVMVTYGDLWCRYG